MSQYIPPLSWLNSFPFWLSIGVLDSFELVECQKGNAWVILGSLHGVGGVWMDKSLWPLYGIIQWPFLYLEREYHWRIFKAFLLWGGLQVFREKGRTPSKLFLGEEHLPVFSGFVRQVKAAVHRSHLPWAQTLHNSIWGQMRTKQFFLFTSQGYIEHRAKTWLEESFFREREILEFCSLCDTGGLHGNHSRLGDLQMVRLLTLRPLGTWVPPSEKNHPQNFATTQLYSLPMEKIINFTQTCL